MFENKSNPPHDSKALSEAMDWLMDMMIENETNPEHKVKMTLARQCKKLSHKFADIAKEYAMLGEESTKSQSEAEGMLEYLTLVEVGVNQYLEMQKGQADARE
jgi:hypothetical protein|nr:MAG TPA: hypothetical protein [Caudoviricetes sp.]